MPYRNLILGDSPTAYFRLGESSGTAAVDECGGASGAHINTPTLGVAGALTNDPNLGITYTAASSEYTQCGDKSLAEDKSYTLEAWVKSTSATADFLFMVCEGNSASVASVAGICMHTGVARAYYRNDAWGVIQVTGTTAINDGNWHHIVCTGNGTTLTLYVDGNSEGTPATFPVGVITIDQLAIGCRWGTAAGYFWPGSIDEVAVYPTGLSVTQVQAHYNARAMGPSAGGLEFPRGVGRGIWR
jgi:hypothetical protein